MAGEQRRDGARIVRPPPPGASGPPCPGLLPLFLSPGFRWGEEGAAGVGLGLVLTQGACSEGATGDRGRLDVSGGGRVEAGPPPPGPGMVALSRPLPTISFPAGTRL